MATSLPVTSTTYTLKNACEAVLPTNNFATVELTADTCVLSNRSSPLDQEERLTFIARPIAKVNTDLQIRNPAPVKAGVQYTIMLEETVRTTDANGNIICDEPLVMLMTVRHPRSANITEAVVKQALRRFLGCVLLPGGATTDTVMDLSASGHSITRFLDLARFAELPNRDAVGGTSDT